MIFGSQATDFSQWWLTKTPYKWKKLGQAADFFGYDWGDGHAHDSLADAKATMFVYRNLTEVADYLNG